MGGGRDPDCNECPVLLQDRGQHHHVVVALRVFKFRRTLAEFVVVAVRLGFNVSRQAIKSFETREQVAIFGAAQMFRAKVPQGNFRGADSRQEAAA